MKKVTNCDVGGRESRIWHLLIDVIFEWPLNYWMTYPTFFSLLEVVSKAPLFVSFSVHDFLQMLLNGVGINTDLESFLSLCISSQPRMMQLLVHSPSVYCV